MVGCQPEKWLGNASPGEETAFSASGDVGRDRWTYKPSCHNKWIKFWITEKLHLLVVALYGHCFGIHNHLSRTFWTEGWVFWWQSFTFWQKSKDCSLKLVNGAMSSWHCTWEEGRLPFRSRVQGWGSHVCPLLQLHSPPTAVSGQERDCHKWERCSHLQLIDYLQIWPVPKETKHPITFKGFPRN